MSLFPGAPYRYAAEAAGLVFTAGACPLDEGGRVVAPGDLEAQSERTVQNLLLALEGAGVTAAAIVKTTVYVATSERADLVRAWEIISPHLNDAPSTLLGVTTLGYPDQLVEVEAVASTQNAR